ncbi:MAG: preprotein translocase subunit SecY [Candidatus Midichloriaceae bacterium]|jgi:preprotein translocase subunit SecY|nr:preprotein translocase subunit SecY [Candidatus Midichloriaceae bacterium]
MSLLSKKNNNLSSPVGSMGDLKSKILFVLFMLIIYRLGTFVPLPGVNTLVMDELTNAHAGGVLGMFNMLTGGALGRLSIFALNIMPYITASIIMQLMTVISPNIASLKKDGDSGRKKINQYTRYLTILLAIFQGYGVAVGVENLSVSSGAVVYDPGFFFRFVATLSLTGGTVLVMWLAEQINGKGIGNGSSLIIFSGIVSGLPNAVASLFEMGRTGALSTLLIMFILVLAILLVSGIVFFEKAQRRISINYPKRQMGNKVYGGETTHLPLKLNTSGVIPAIFASSLLLFPATIAGFGEGPSAAEGWRHLVSLYLSHGKPLYIILEVVLITFFCFFYTSVIFNPDETAENLRKNGGVILGRRPGKHTSEYLDYVLTRITVVGSIYMVCVCVIPELMIAKFSIPFYLGGTSILIVVNVVLDIYAQIQTHMLSLQYGNLLKKAKIKGRI